MFLPWSQRLGLWTCNDEVQRHENSGVCLLKEEEVRKGGTNQVKATWKH